MDLFDVLLQIALVTSALVLYLIFIRGRKDKKGPGLYVRPGWNFPLKYVCARYAVKRWKARKPQPALNEQPRTDLIDGFDCLTIRATGADRTVVLLALRKLCRRQSLAEMTVHIQLPDGTTYKLPSHPDTLVGVWNGSSWTAGGLKVEVLEPMIRLRLQYNGMLTRTDTNTTQHARFSFIWNTGSKVVSHPGDWSEELAARALAMEPWRNGKWPYMLDKWGDGGWLQWGCVQGWFEFGDCRRLEHVKTWLRARGVRKRFWAPHGYRGLRRSVSIMATARDGTAVHLRVHSYKQSLTQMLAGSVRFPNSNVEVITSTDFNMEEFCEVKEELPPIFSFNISTKTRNLRLIIHIGSEGGRLLSGLPYQHEIVYKILQYGEINGYPATGILELGYEAIRGQPLVSLSPARRLRWLDVEDVGEVGFCVELESRAAGCPGLVGGKGASLGLLTSMQDVEGYRVPSGFCLTTKALNQHVDDNPDLMLAIREIEKANEDYKEENFKDKCKMTVELFAATKINGILKEDILKHVSNLRRKIDLTRTRSNEISFAVRSSGVGEDGEGLSAAGQNETVLGCKGDEDILRAVGKCWGSMFAFTSAHYRRQNGQPCWTGSGVVVQTLIAPKAAGVVFTRHPQAGDPSRLLITANYGIGETVVSGAVEPDTIVVSRRLEDKLSIVSVELGSKKRYLTSSDDGVVTLEVPEEKRTAPCLTDGEVLSLARSAIVQEELWGAPRDIEWAIDHEGVIYFLQARPITSLELWSEEELLHEMDSPVMSDEELFTVANVGEVLPKSISPLSQDLVLIPLGDGMASGINNKPDPFDGAIFLSHNRCIINMYNNFYRLMPPKMDMTIRMVEMAMHGHKVADDRIHSIAVHRRPPKLRERILTIWLLIKVTLLSNWYTKDVVRKVETANIDKLCTDDVKVIYEAIKNSQKDITHYMFNHVCTTGASTASQVLAMNILLEGAQDFSTEHCSDLGIISGCGDVISTEVPLRLKKLVQELMHSGRVDEFKRQKPQDGMQWLRSNLPDIYSKITAFLDKHGHRALMEFDLATKPWILEPEGLIEALQNMNATTENNLIAKNDNDIVASLISPKKNRTRTFLRWLLPVYRRMVANRETSKAYLILGIHKVRLAARRLGNIMVRNWMLPNPELVFFFTLKELNRYIETRDPGLLRKAVQRHHYYPKWDKLKFAEIQEGWPEPVKAKGPRLAAVGATLVATPVSSGEVIARACVIQDLSEIGQLQRGDILVTYSTDIGWSPYFPLLSGIVTELGGLISHGAVIARECGLPCIVGATGATDLFRSGDLVRLCGSTGILEKVQHCIEENVKPEKLTVV